MNWAVEYITEESSNVLCGDEPVGMGFPVKLAERIVLMHNDQLEKAEERIEELEKVDFTYEILESLLMTKLSILGDATPLEFINNGDKESILDLMGVFNKMYLR